MEIDIIGWLHTLPSFVIYVTVLLVVGVESLGVPLPGEITLMSAALLASKQVANPWVIWAVGATGAVVGDSIGYYIGLTHGHRLLNKMNKWFPRHVNEHTIHLAKTAFHRHGLKTVFFGRFVAILRIFAGPLAGMLKMPYEKFLVANATGGIVWSGLAVWVVYYLGIIAEQWFSRFSWIALGVALVIGTVFSMMLRKQIEISLDKRQDK